MRLQRKVAVERGKFALSQLALIRIMQKVFLYGMGVCMSRHKIVISSLIFTNILLLVFLLRAEAKWLDLRCKAGKVDAKPNKDRHKVGKGHVCIVCYVFFDIGSFIQKMTNDCVDPIIRERVVVSSIYRNVPSIEKLCGSENSNSCKALSVEEAMCIISRHMSNTLLQIQKIWCIEMVSCDSVDNYSSIQLGDIGWIQWI